MGNKLFSESSLRVYNPAIELVKSLVTETKRRQLLWESNCDIMSTKLRDATSIQFLVHSSVSDSKDWSLFTVHSAGGQRLLKVTPDANAVNHSSLHAATDALFMAIAERSSAPAGSS
jgi:hypothetical protein